MAVSTNLVSNHKRLLLYIAGITLLMCMALVSLLLITKPKPVHAAPYVDCTTHFVCPENVLGATVAWDGSLDLSATNSSGQPAGDDANPRQVTAGESIRVDTSYEVNSASTFGSQALIWVNADIFNSTSPGPGPYQSAGCGINGGFSNFTRNPAVGTRIENTNCAADGFRTTDPIIKPNNCPSFYTRSTSNYGPNIFPNGAVYPVSFSDPAPASNLDHISTCGFLGASVMWHGDMRNPGQTYNYGFNFRTHPNWVEGKVCFRSNLSAGAGGPGAIITNLYARSASRKCFEVIKATVTGKITSSNVLATGKPLGGYNIRVSRGCNFAESDFSVPVAANGLYSFEVAQGQQYCIYPPVPLTNDGTTYPVVSPSERVGTCNSSSCPGHDFVYDPQELSPTVTKTAVPQIARADGSVKPGEYVDFTITAYNSYDSNTQNVDIRDYIPLNIISNPSSPLYPRIQSFQMFNHLVGGRPSWWNAASFGPHPGGACIGDAFPTYFAYGSGSPILSTGIRCGYSMPGGFTPPSMYLSFERMPAYSFVVLKWRGYVKPADEIGVYPADGSYCSGVGVYNKHGYFPECVNTASGLQGVINRVSARAQNAPLGNVSNITYNPIPGDISCIGKTAVAEENPDSGTSTGCAGVVYANEYLYSPDPAAVTFNRARIKLNVSPDTTGGPVDYRVQDNLTFKPMDAPTAADVSPSDSSFGVDPGPVVRWNRYAPTYRYPNNGNLDYWFDTTFNNSGGNFTNIAQVCIIQYWLPGNPRPVLCKPSNPISFVKANVDQPYLTSRQGDIHAGGGPASGSCSLAETSDMTGIRNNTGGKGWYVVSTNSTNLDGFTSIAGQLNPNYGVRCRPDLVQAAEDLISRKPAILGAGPNIAGKILHVIGDYTIDASKFAEITQRWTLFVEGNIQINQDVKYKPAGNLLADSPSFGVITTGSIYVHPSVSRLDGYYYARGRINTCAELQPDGTVKSLEYRVQSEGVGGAVRPGFTPRECGYDPPRALSVNGFLMAQKFRYNRAVKIAPIYYDPITGAYEDVWQPGYITVSAGHSEIANFTDRLFLATPPAFTDLANRANSLYGGERRPRY